MFGISKNEDPCIAETINRWGWTDPADVENLRMFARTLRRSPVVQEMLSAGELSEKELATIEKLLDFPVDVMEVTKNGPETLSVSTGTLMNWVGSGRDFTIERGPRGGWKVRCTRVWLT